MPGMSGATLAEKVTELHPDVKILYVSGYAGEELVRRGFATIRDNILVKPFDPDQLLDRLSEVLRERAE